jgi:hypothetical protein
MQDIRARQRSHDRVKNRALWFLGLAGSIHSRSTIFSAVYFNRIIWAGRTAELSNVF